MKNKNTPYSVLVAPEWADYNDHLTESYYLYIFSEACDDFYHLIGVNQKYRDNGLSYFTVETNIQHRNEVKTGERVHVTTQICAVDDKRIHLVHKMVHSNSSSLLAVCEQILLHVDLTKRRACCAPKIILQALEKLKMKHSNNDTDAWRLSLPALK